MQGQQAWRPGWEEEQEPGSGTLELTLTGHLALARQPARGALHAGALTDCSPQGRTPRGYGHTSHLHFGGIPHG